MNKPIRYVVLLILVLIPISTIIAIALTIRGISNTPPSTEPSFGMPVSVNYNDNTPDFYYKDFNEENYKSREDVYKDYLKLNTEFNDFLKEYGDSWSEGKIDKNYELYQEYLVQLYNLLDGKYCKKSDADIYAEKEHLIVSKLSDLSDAYIFDRESANESSDEKNKLSYKNSAEEKEKIYKEAEAYYKGFCEGKHSIDDMMAFLGIDYSELADPLFIPPEYNYQVRR